MKIVVIHPGKQHSFQLATALKKHGLLCKYITSVYYRKGSLTYYLQKIVKGDLKKKLIGRHCNAIDDSDVCQLNELMVIITLFLNRFPSLQKVAEYWNLYTESLFYRRAMNVVKKLKPDAIIIYNGYSNKHLDLIKGLGIPVIMDVSIAAREYVQKILQKEIDCTGLNQIKQMHFSYWNQRMLKNDIKGCELCDFFLAPSIFVYDSLKSIGVASRQIKLVPYGVNIDQFHPLQKKYSKPLKLIYVGSVTYRKGIHRLLNVVDKLEDVELYLAGTYDKESLLYRNYKDCKNVHFEGFVTRDKLNYLYNRCDVFVLPSFCEGMAMVGLEAMACGLPMICTYYTGVNDVIVNGGNGFVYNADDESALTNFICWFKNNRSKLPEMSKNARETALHYSWDNYHENVVSAIKNCINKNK